MKRLLYLIGAVCLTGCLTTQVWAGEYVLLGNGFRLHADRHELAGQVVKVYSGAGVVELPAASIAGYEEEEVMKVASEPEAVPVAPVALPVQPPTDIAGRAARKFQLPDAFVRSVMEAESGFRQDAVSPKGAIGLMQLMPDTARQLGVNPHDPGQNAEGGARYLRELLARYEDDPNQVLLALAAYNAGPAAVDRYHGVPPYSETRQYILRVLKNWDRSGGK